MGNQKCEKQKTKKMFFAGVSGSFYPFTLYPLGTDLPDGEAVYIFTKAEDGSCEPLYIGQTGTLKSTTSAPAKWICVSRLCVNALCVHFEKDATVRKQIANDLIEMQCPPCND